MYVSLYRYIYLYIDIYPQDKMMLYKKERRSEREIGRSMLVNYVFANVAPGLR